jgi:hypothetical protein
MTLKDLKRMISQQSTQEDEKMQELKRRLYNRPFYIWNSDKHRDAAQNHLNKGWCCFNHVIGLPKKDGVEKPLFNYEDVLYRALMIPGYINSKPNSSNKFLSVQEKRQRETTLKDTYLYDFKLKHLWVKKATGLGVTEFCLRFMCWLCLRNDDYKDSQMCIITGPNQDIAIKSIKRMKGLFTNHGIQFDTKETVIELNGCSIEA